MTPCDTCSTLATRLENAKTHYRAQQAELDRLREIVTRYQRIGVRRFHEKETSQTIVGTDVWFQNTILRRAIVEREEKIRRQAELLKSLHMLLHIDDQRGLSPEQALVLKNATWFRLAPCSHASTLHQEVRP